MRTITLDARFCFCFFSIRFFTSWLTRCLSCINTFFTPILRDLYVDTRPVADE